MFFVTNYSLNVWDVPLRVFGDGYLSRKEVFEGMYTHGSFAGFIGRYMFEN